MTNIQTFSIFLLLAGICASALAQELIPSLCFVESKIEEVKAQNPKIDYLGNFESRHFFLDGAGRTSWQHAQNYCSNIGMQPINVETQALASWLYEKLSPGTRYYWINGQDVAEQSQFKLSNGKPFNTEVRTWFQKKSCLMIHATQMGTIYNTECFNNTNEPYTICELPC